MDKNTEKIFKTRMFFEAITVINTSVRNILLAKLGHAQGAINYKVVERLMDIFEITYAEDVVKSLYPLMTDEEKKFLNNLVNDIRKGLS